MKKESEAVLLRIFIGEDHKHEGNRYISFYWIISAY